MDKNTYLKKLARQLARWMPDREREDTMRWYEEYFEEAGPEQEAQVAEELGSPAALARRLAQEGGWNTQKKGAGKTAGVVVAAVLAVAALNMGIWGAFFRAAPDSSAANPGVSANTPGTPSRPNSLQPVQALGQSPGSGSSQSQKPGSDPVQVLSAFTEIEAEIAIGDVTIRSGEGFQIEADYHGTVNGTPYRIEYEVTDGVLVITSVPKKVDDGKGTCGAKVVVTLPEDCALDEAELSVGVGDVTVRDVTADEIDVKAGVGDLSFHNVTAGQIEANAGVGDVSIIGTPAAAMELASGVGEVSAKLDCDPEDCGYILTSGVGQIKANGTTTLLAASKKVPGASCQLTGASGVGNVTLTFTD